MEDSITDSAYDLLDNDEINPIEQAFMIGEKEAQTRTIEDETEEQEEDE